MAFQGKPPARRKLIASAINTSCDASGFVTIAHGGGSVPICVQLSGRNFAHYPYLTSVTDTTFTVRFLSRSNGAALTAVTAVSFDWTCHFS